MRLVDLTSEDLARCVGGGPGPRETAGQLKKALFAAIHSASEMVSNGVGGLSEAEREKLVGHIGAARTATDKLRLIDTIAKGQIAKFRDP